MTKEEMRQWRLSLGLRESDVAAMFGETEQEIKNYESGRKAIDAKITGKVNKHRRNV